MESIASTKQSHEYVCTIKVIVEVQGFRNNEDDFAKKVAVVTVNDSFVDHWILLSPHSFKELSNKARRVNNWLLLNYHGIEWHEGV